jgi:hypothetical protein
MDSHSIDQPDGAQQGLLLCKGHLKIVYLSFIDLLLFIVELDEMVKFILFFTFDLEFGLEFVL